MRRGGLRRNQLEALRACLDPVEGFSFWRRAGAFGTVDGRGAAGARHTLQSLARRGLIAYDDGWRVTAEGRRVLAEHDSS